MPPAVPSVPPVMSAPPHHPVVHDTAALEPDDPVRDCGGELRIVRRDDDRLFPEQSVSMSPASFCLATGSSPSVGSSSARTGVSSSGRRDADALLLSDREGKGGGGKPQCPMPRSSRTRPIRCVITPGSCRVCGGEGELLGDGPSPKSW
jgi:hypothetical protein